MFFTKWNESRGRKHSTYLDIFENPPVIRVSHNIIHRIWRQPNIDFHIEIAQRTFWYTDLPRITSDSKHPVAQIKPYKIILALERNRLDNVLKRLMFVANISLPPRLLEIQTILNIHHISCHIKSLHVQAVKKKIAVVLGTDITYKESIWKFFFYQYLHLSESAFLFLLTHITSQLLLVLRNNNLYKKASLTHLTLSHLYFWRLISPGRIFSPSLQLPP